MPPTITAWLVPGAAIIIAYLASRFSVDEILIRIKRKR